MVGKIHLFILSVTLNGCGYMNLGVLHPKSVMFDKVVTLVLFINIIKTVSYGW